MSTERIDVEALRGRSDIVRITAEGTREVAAKCSADMRPFMHLRAAELEQIANEYDALLAEVIERRASDAELIADLRQAIDDVKIVRRVDGDGMEFGSIRKLDDVERSLAAAIAAIQGAQP